MRDDEAPASAKAATAVRPLSAAWETEAQRWAAWARTPGHDSYWRFHRDAFLPILPPPGRLTVDVGCGEGRLARDLKMLGHTVRGFDASPTMIRLAQEESPEMQFEIASAESLPLSDGEADLVVAFMSYQDVDDLEGAVSEAARVLSAGSCLCLAIVHPINSAGYFASKEPDAPFVIEGSYLTCHRYSDKVDRDGLRMTFHSMHRPMEEYTRCLEQTGFVIEALREVTEPKGATPGDESSSGWSGIPLFLHVRAVLGEGSACAHACLN